MMAFMDGSRASQMTAAMLGMAGPITVGVMTGHPQAGLLASLGGLALSGDGKGATFREQAPGLIYAMIASSAAVFAGSAVAGRGLLTALAIPAVVAVIGLLGGISRPLARASTQFILFAIIAANLAAIRIDPFSGTLCFFIGAVWTAFLFILLRPLFQAMPFAKPLEHPAPSVQTPKRSFGQLVLRWWHSLARFTGWQYPLRIASCLLVAEAFDWSWPDHHGYWASITVAIVVHRNLRIALPRAVQRAVGTFFGVLFISLFLLVSPSVWLVVAIVALLALLRPIFMEIHYTAYAAVMTPLVILLLDFGHIPSLVTAMDRLAATLVGCILALTIGYLLWFRFFIKMDSP
ncbi:MAG: FUSC family protein [Deltaproteobacteria bacterium]|nr:FUSC family protein [Deltaproteobacteria bacterium]